MLNAGMVLQDRYRILSRIGGGGMGTVYLAEDTRLQGRQCAVKEMSPEALAPKDRAWSIEAFRQEARLLAQLHHPGLTAVTDFFGEDSNWYLVMDYVEGETLEKRLAQAPGGCFPVQEALRIARQILDVLDYLHTQPTPVVFRDLKPGNVMCTPEGQIKLIDFGIARFFKPGKTQDTTFLGTPGFAAPEQYGGMGQSDARTDIYSLGVLLHQMVTGFDPTTAVSPFPVPDPRTVMPSIPVHVAETIKRATQLRPELRFGTIAEMRQNLVAPAYPPTGVSVTRTSVMSVPLGATAQPQPRGRRTSGIWIGLGIAALVILVCGGLAFVAFSQDLIAFPDLFGTGPAAHETRARVADPTESPTLTREPTVQPDDAPPTPETVEVMVTEEVTVEPTQTESPTPRPARLAYVRGDVGNTDIYVAEADGRNQICVACESCDEAEPAWTLDGRFIAYQSNCGGNYDIWTVDVESRARTRLIRTADTDEREPDWSPDGARLVYRATALNTARNEDGDLRIMGRDGSGGASLGIQGRSPTWSPDGDRLVFMSERDGTWQIYVYELDSRQTRKVTNCSANCRWPSWSPDGRAVIYHATTGPGSVTADTLWITPLDGGTSTQVVDGSHAGRPSWSAEGWVVFNSDNGIEVVTVQGQNRRTLLAGDVHWAPVWSR